MKQNELNLPAVITHDKLKQVMIFAEGELSYLALHGTKTGNPGLPLTGNQKRQQGEKKRRRREGLQQPRRHPQLRLLPQVEHQRVTTKGHIPKARTVRAKARATRSSIYSSVACPSARLRMFPRRSLRSVARS